MSFIVLIEMLTFEARVEENQKRLDTFMGQGAFVEI